MARKRCAKGAVPPITPLRTVRHRVAGIDIGASEHWVCIDPDLDDQPVRKFSAFSDDLQRLVQWLQERGIRSVAMEATGPYWFQLFRLLTEVGIEVILVDPRQTRNPRNRKTDMLDCQHIWQMHAHGMLSAAFVPGDAVQRLRTYCRFRQGREASLGQALGGMHEAMARMNLKLGHVISDLGGVTGQRIVEAILNGERDGHVLARLRDRRCSSDAATIARALTGTWREEDLFLLEQAHRDYKGHLAAIAECDRRIESLIARISPAEAVTPPRTAKRNTHKTAFAFDAQSAAARLTGIDLTGIDGLGAHSVLNFIAEIGFDVSAWPSSKDFCAWLGLCPNPKRSGGKTIGRMPTTANRAADILKRAAFGLQNKTGTMAEFRARIAKRRGQCAAIKAAAHRYARIIYAMMKHRTCFDPSKITPVWNERQKSRRLEHLRINAAKLGMTLVPAA